MTFEEAITSASREIHCRITFPFLNVDEHYIKSVDWRGNLISGSNFEIGTAIANNVEVVFLDKDAYFDGFDFTGKEFELEFGILVDAVIEYRSVGFYTVEKAPRLNGKITIQAMDRMYKADIPYVSGVTYPSTVYDVLVDACTQSGLALATLTFANDGLSIPVEPSFYTVTCRNVIQACAEVAGGYAKIDEFGELAIVTLSDLSPRVIEPSNYITFVPDFTAQSTITKVIVQLGDVTSELGTGTASYTVANNLLIQTPSDAVGELFAVLDGLTFTSNNLRWQGDFSLPIGQAIQINTGSDTYYSFLLNRRITYNGGMIEESRSPALSSVVKNSMVNGALTLATQKALTQIQVLDGQIALKVDQTDFDNLGNEVSSAQASITILQNEITTKVSQTSLEEQLEEYSTITQTNDVVSIAIGSVQVVLDEYGETINNVNINFDFTGEGLRIRKSGNPFEIAISNEEMDFINGGIVTAYINGSTMYIQNVVALEKATIGVHQIFRNGSTNVTLITSVGGV